MLSPTAPLILPTFEDGSKNSRELNRRNGVIFIAILEMLACVAGSTIYIYALIWEPAWAPHLVPIPEGLCSSTNMVHGMMYVFILLFLMEFFQAVCLFDGARRESLGRVRFWLYSMLTYLVLLSIVVIGLELGGIRSPTMNSVAFINIFIRFLEIMIVYAWSEQEAMNRLRLLNTSRRNGRCLERAPSTTTIASMIDAGTPPPSYDSTLPPMSSQQSSGINSPHPSTSSAAAQQRNHNQILPVVSEVEVARTNQWKKQWEQ